MPSGFVTASMTFLRLAAGEVPGCRESGRFGRGRHETEVASVGWSELGREEVAIAATGRCRSESASRRLRVRLDVAWGALGRPPALHLVEWRGR